MSSLLECVLSAQKKKKVEKQRTGSNITLPSQREETLVDGELRQNCTPSTSERVPEPVAKRWKPLASKNFYSPPISAEGPVVSGRNHNVEMMVMRYLMKLKEKAATKQRDRIWMQFNTQQEAFDFMDGEDPDGEYLHVFSQELESSGTRKFVVSSLVEFWSRYKDIPQRFRHFYEIIREGTPCNAYIDFEYNIEENPDMDGEKAVDGLIVLMKKVLREQLDINMDEKWLIELESSSATKFSRHLILRLPGAAFVDNSHVGHFVDAIVREAWTHRQTSKSCSMMFVRNTHGQETTCIDTGVYSRNRAFRLFLSSKAGKNISLQPTGRMMKAWGNEFPDEKIFMHSLVGHVEDGSRMISCSERGEDEQVFKVTEGMGVVRRQGRMNAGTHEKGPSPYPELDEFVMDVCRRNIPDGSRRGNVGIRSWISLDDGSVLLYNLSGYRYCDNIGREHKSNGVFFVVDLKQAAWYQKCYDPDCRNYKSPACPIPPHVLGHKQA
ncbi:hypothetical protein M9434_001042 [Picochlorum sp. BPE23]|nr:hypothetical protein M9434_001042 [Picochlorum sp. BPE23]